MALTERLKLIQEIEELRGSKVICYLTSTRPNLAAQMSEDAVRVFFDHLLLFSERPVKRLDIFLCSNGGNGTVPWRLVSLFREFAESIGVLLPYRAYSAATMLALGADDIIMHPFAEMGPIDPTVTNDFNPVDENTKQKIGISVEDVKAYVSFIKDTVGIRHEDELVKAVEILANKVHPLALGNVERFISQNRMITRKILLTHMKEESSKHEIDETIETLASKLYFHGHPINRREAREELKLKVAENVPPALETAMWKLYLEYEKELLNDQIFDPMRDIFSQASAIPQQPGQGPLPPLVPIGTSVVVDTKLAMIESSRRTSAYEMKRRLVVVGTGGLCEPLAACRA
jgi:Serine dehydrogenase proteinase